MVFLVCVGEADSRRQLNCCKSSGITIDTEVETEKIIKKEWIELVVSFTITSIFNHVKSIRARAREEIYLEFERLD